MLTSSPRHLAMVPFFATAILIYLFSTPSQRKSTLKSTHGLSGWPNSPPNDDTPATACVALITSAPNSATSEITSALPGLAPAISALVSAVRDVEPKQTGIPTTSPALAVNHTELGGPTKIHQVTMIFEDNGPEHDVYERALKLHLAHGERWGYTTHVLRQDIVGDAEENGRNIKGHWKSGVFKKPLYLLSVVINELAKPADERAEWIIWIDGDTIILNPNIRWEHFLPPSDPLFSDIHFIGSQAWYGFNCGVFFMRVSEWTVHFLTDVSALPRLRKEFELFGQSDQNAMKHVLRWEGRPDNVIYEPRVWFNGYHSGKDNETEPRDGDLLVHFAGYYGNRTVAMGDWLDRVEKEPEKLAIPFGETKVIGEIEGFWSRMWEAKTRLQEMTLEMQKYNTTTVHKVSEELLDAVRYYPFDNKRLDDAMQNAGKAFTKTPESIVSQPGNDEQKSAGA